MVSVGMSSSDVAEADTSLTARFIDGSCMSVEGAETVEDVHEFIAEARGSTVGFREVVLVHRGCPIYTLSQRLSELNIQPGEDISVVYRQPVAQSDNPAFRFEPLVPANLRVWRLLHSHDRVRLRRMRDLARFQGRERLMWIAAHTLKAHEDVARITAIFADVGICTHESCPSMCAGQVVYRWSSEENEQPQEIPAPAYAARLVLESETVLSDPSMIPHDDDQPIPESFEVSARKLLRRFFRVFAHAYLCHFDSACFYEVDECIHAPFRHFVHFVTEFSLVNDCDMAPLQLIVQRFRKDTGFSFFAAHNP
eukprot:TRINITY_DN23519_c0_g1_i1.p1 TRINITY_DN23519_c0_g1~~TRINITY_DN23519_c0_g1_i1.p1  ORF type:complete len:326 (+),score=37.92 TRINITY_DN23519_c0_g1_i1:49-978(+)